MAEEPVETNSGNDGGDTDGAKKRGFWLTAFLILMFIANPLSAITYFSSPDAVAAAVPGASIGIIYLLGTLSLVNVALAIGIWNWKVWGIYGFYGIVVVAFVINMAMGLGIGQSLLGVIGGVIIFLCTRNKMEHFE